MAPFVYDRGMSNKNPFGVLRRGPQEWGAQSRQDDDKLRGARGRANRQNIEEGLNELEDED